MMERFVGLVCLAVTVFVMAPCGAAQEAVVDAQESKRKCCMPRQFSADMTALGTVNSMAITTFVLQTDYSRMQMALLNYTIPAPPAHGPPRPSGKVLVDFGKKVEYYIPGDQPGRCYKFPYSEPQDRCVPETAELFSAGYLGSMGRDRLPYEVWRLQVPLIYKGAPTANATVTLAVTRTCTPIMEATFIPGLPAQNQLYLYSNFQPKLTDPSAFHLPKICTQ